MRRLKKLPAKTFLDIGCGAGDLDCQLVMKLGMSGQGIDFSKTAIDIANQLKDYYRLAKQPDFKLVKSSIPKTTPKADLVLCLEVLEHIKDDEALLRQLVGLSNRYVVISVPAKQKLFSHSDKLAGHYRRYEKESLKAMMERNGLQVDSLIAYGYPFTNWIRWARETVARRKSQTVGSKEEQSKKSGVDLMEKNHIYSLPLEKIIWPLYHISRSFNHLNRSEGYLVIAEKRS